VRLEPVDGAKQTSAGALTEWGGGQARTVGFRGWAPTAKSMGAGRVVAGLLSVGLVISMTSKGYGSCDVVGSNLAGT
jgi:hypothetical protein